ncbi:hypothetical protein MATL_G00137060 [Megalops atlanticus]|uniref:Uncharacterized protein n=1 Tax=Megalops atlanticus TaxID=7932 RepID=A0A9D3PXC3_MEGAT|nr:hypothetical protein MATL_G00137060 [Megalops atlanticus]
MCDCRDVRKRTAAGDLEVNGLWCSRGGIFSEPVGAFGRFSLPFLPPPSCPGMTFHPCHLCWGWCQNEFLPRRTTGKGCFVNSGCGTLQ